MKFHGVKLQRELHDEGFNCVLMNGCDVEKATICMKIPLESVNFSITTL
jgi:hypothetical protein